MRKLLYTLVASALVAALVPATALAQGHHRRHHARHHHARVHHRQFGRSSDPATPSMNDNAGTVQSFDGTTLTILLADGTTTVSGTVNNDTEIECEAADMSGTSFNRDDEGGDHSGSGDQGDQGDQGDNNDNDDNNAQNCDTSSLTPGAIVHEAELKLSGAGAVWDKVDLLSSSSSTSSSGDDD